MRNDLVDVTLLVDRSASMATIKLATEEGIDAFVNKQRENKSETRLSLIEFDDRYGVVYVNRPINEIGRYELLPRGNTADEYTSYLLAAIKLGIRETGERLAAMPFDSRPGKVFFIIVTNGQENSSHFIDWERGANNEVINEIITHQREKYSWNILFIGSNQDAIATASKYGIMRGSALTFANNSMGTRASYDSLARAVNKLADVDHNVYTAAVQSGETFCQADRDAQVAAGLNK